MITVTEKLRQQVEKVMSASGQPPRQILVDQKEYIDFFYEHTEEEQELYLKNPGSLIMARTIIPCQIFHGIPVVLDSLYIKAKERDRELKDAEGVEVERINYELPPRTII